MEAVAKYDFEKTAEDELDFKKGALLKILNFDQDINWYRAEIDGTSGFVPKNYLQVKEHNWFVGSMSRQDAQELLLRPASNLPDGAYLVRHSETTPGEFSLSVKYQDDVQHFKVLRDGGGKYFLWVVKFISLNAMVDYHRTSSVSRSHFIVLKDTNLSGVKEGTTAEALYDFEPQEADELQFKSGSTITVLDMSDEHWWRGKLGSAEGVFPSTYVRIQNDVPGVKGIQQQQVSHGSRS